MPFFNDYQQPRLELDLEKNRYVPVILSTDTEGNSKPLYFRYTNKDYTSEKVSIDRVECSEKNSLFGMNYYCVVTIHGVQMNVVLFHGKEDNKWALRLRTKKNVNI